MNDYTKDFVPPVYIAGKMNGIPGLNFAAFDAVENWLTATGVKCINPARLDREVGINPPLSQTHELSGNMRAIAFRDLNEITLKAKSICVLPGWETSKGTAAEIATAKWIGIPVIYLPADCPAFDNPNKQPNAVLNVINSVSVDTTKHIPEDTKTYRADTKDTNPKDACGRLKAGVSCVPMNVISEVGLALIEGSKKYGSHNYRKAGVRSSIYIDALWRHVFLQWWDQGQDNDEESDCSHITKGIACLVILRDAMLNGMLNDDRPISSVPIIEELNAKAKELSARNPNPVEPYTKKQQQ